MADTFADRLWGIGVAAICFRAGLKTFWWTRMPIC